MKGRKSKKGKVVIISGPSGVGKSTICKEVIKRLDDVELNISVTTRPKAKSERDGLDYWFVSKQQFKERIDRGEFLEYVEVFGNLYGTPKDKVEQALQAGKTVILEIDVQGAKQVKAIYPDAVMIFILAKTKKTIEQRLSSRGRDEEAAAELRLGGADAEIAAARKYYEHLVINDDLKQAVDNVVEIVGGKG